jgi:hypothetical protein
MPFATLSRRPLRPSEPRAGALATFGRMFGRHWRGEHGLLAAFTLPALILVLLRIVLSWVLDSVDWVWHYRASASAAMGLICVSLAASVWGLVGAARSARRADEAGESAWRVRGPVSLLAALAIATTGELAVEVNVWLHWLWILAQNKGQRADVSVTAGGDRAIVKGDFGLGTTRRLAEVLAANPGVRLVELNSPGGMAVEGLALGKLLLERKVDTVVLRTCASACVTAFAGGERRLLGPEARLALHSVSEGKGKLKLDQAHAEFLASRGVAGWLINFERATPNSSIWLPGPVELLESQLVTDSLRLAPNAIDDVTAVPGR